MKTCIICLYKSNLGFLCIHICIWCVRVSLQIHSCGRHMHFHVLVSVHERPEVHVGNFFLLPEVVAPAEPRTCCSSAPRSLSSLVLEFRAYVTMPGLLCVCRVSKLGSQACSVSSSTWLSWKEAAFLTPLLLGPLSSWLGTCVLRQSVFWDTSSLSPALHLNV